MTAFTEQQQIDEAYIPTEQDWEDVFAEEQEHSFLFSGFNTRQRRQVTLGYMAPTAQEAWDICARLNPDLIVMTWGLAENMV
jgi:hypothetical protein